MNYRRLYNALCLLLLQFPSYATSTEEVIRTTYSASCSALAGVDFSKTPDAPTQVMEARSFAHNGDLPEYCEVRGYVTPNVGFVLRLPSNKWNRKLIEVGCGGFCGSTDAMIAFCDDPVRNGYACVVSDSGHQSTLGDAKWAYNNLQAETDFGYRGAHVTSSAGKAIIERYYGQSPKLSYFMGGSTGGRQAMMEAQRFPQDFQGIIAGCPSFDDPDIFMSVLWANRVLTSNQGASSLRQTDLELIHNAVLAKCDLNDGIKDGLIGDPRSCNFDLSELRCKASSQPGHCLTDVQVATAKSMYSGPITSHGDIIYMPDALLGSELTWLDSFVGAVGEPSSVYNAIRDAFSYSLLQPNPGPAWRPEEFDFDRDYPRLGLAKVLQSATNPDLRPFQSTGGKLLMYAGWNDAAFNSLAAVDYYETVERTMGGREATQDFFRLFMLPGVNHCTFGDGAFAVDYLGYLNNWVEKGQRPDQLLSSHVRFDDLSTDPNTPTRMRRTPVTDPSAQSAETEEIRRRLTMPLNPRWVDFSRPVYPYPTNARYSGHGDPRDPANFGPTITSTADLAHSDRVEK